MCCRLHSVACVCSSHAPTIFVSFLIHMHDYTIFHKPSVFLSQRMIDARSVLWLVVRSSLNEVLYDEEGIAIFLA